MTEESSILFRPPETSDPSVELITEDGIDLTLIRWMLSLTPLERLMALQDTVESLAHLRGCIIET